MLATNKQEYSRTDTRNSLARLLATQPTPAGNKIGITRPPRLWQFPESGFAAGAFSCSGSVRNELRFNVRF
jgi:hypothetical protein